MYYLRKRIVRTPVLYVLQSATLTRKMFFFIVFQVSLCVFAVYVLSSSDNFLDPQKAFVSINLFNTLNWSTSFIPIFLAHAAQVRAGSGGYENILRQRCLSKMALVLQTIFPQTFSHTNENIWISNKISLKYVHGWFDWRYDSICWGYGFLPWGKKPQPEPMLNKILDTIRPYYTTLI